MNLSTSKNKKNPIKFKIFIAGFFVTALAGFFYFFGPYFLLKVDKNFSYSANVVSLDNFFDKTSDQFLGDERSVTTFGYDFVSQVDGHDLVTNFFEVRTITGDKIISINRDYSINPYSWSHVDSGDSGSRSGYLFAPRGLKRGEVFDYWHVNYNEQLSMIFVKEEVVGGLKVYKYNVSFGVDQTSDLTHLPGVPDELGVNLDVSLNLWIEPASGWLVKYEDSAIAYYYDQQTGKRVYPWNKFSNRYTRSSILTQVDRALEAKRLVYSIKFALPVILLSLFFAWMFLRRDNRKQGVFTIIFGMVVVILILIFAQRVDNSNNNLIKIGIAPWVPSGNDVYVRNIDGFKDALSDLGYKEGVDVVFIERTANGDPEIQEQIAQFFSQEDVDLIYSLTTPGTVILQNFISNRPIIFSIVTYPAKVGIVDSLQKSGNNLVGTRNWVPIEDQVSIFLEIAPSTSRIGFLHKKNELNSNIQLQEMKEKVSGFNIEVLDIGAKDKEGLIEKLENNLGNIDAIYSACDTLVQSEAERDIISFAHKNKIPSFSCNLSGPLSGDLVGVVADFYQLGKLAGEKAALVLEGVSPSSLETSIVSRPFIYVNLKTAKLLNIKIPQSVLTRAKQIIE